MIKGSLEYYTEVLLHWCAAGVGLCVCFHTDDDKANPSNISSAPALVSYPLLPPAPLPL